ncbi:tail fiber assembly protein [Cedecea sp. FDAARGOS_727]|uniref:tail fiber assembly protein n=1 Tax=Cedecea sp. FDAARGOS_727 TaxID=2545798 RepID=UPI00143EB379|nr:tail fiber assembly protein [Cedecea sp. FDAARGOS_727]QIX97466.1 tail fiber assembly protein [Cedecea sp. FDAARGOS_727]
MNKYVYSPTNNAFYPAELQDVYESAGSWPSDAVSVDDSIYIEFAANTPPHGKQRNAGKDGKPEWIEAASPDPLVLTAIAEGDKVRLLAEATAAISPLQDAVDADIATDEELQQLKVWKTYRVMLNRVDVSAAPEINWPEKPK